VSSGWIIGAVAVVAAYLLGTIPTASLVGGRAGHDPRTEGSHNPGASNVYRLAGWRAGVAVLVVDVGKGVVATVLGLVAGDRELALLTGAAAVLGHVAPVMRRLRGGKGVATAGGMALVLWPVASVVLLGAFAALAVTVRIASVGSLAMAAGLPLGVALTGHDRVEVVAAGVVAVLVIARHHGNIARLIRGEEGQTSPRGPERTTDPAT
jgi:acyl phosphate:glycerol-3-phosphate acyltransferase